MFIILQDVGAKLQVFVVRCANYSRFNSQYTWVHVITYAPTTPGQPARLVQGPLGDGGGHPGPDRTCPPTGWLLDMKIILTYFEYFGVVWLNRILVIAL